MHTRSFLTFCALCLSIGACSGSEPAAAPAPAPAEPTPAAQQQAPAPAPVPAAPVVATPDRALLESAGVDGTARPAIHVLHAP